MTGQEVRDDEREALERVLLEGLHRGLSVHEITASVIAAGYRKHPEPEPLCYVVLEMREPEPWIEDGPFSRDEAIALAAEHTAQMATLDGSRYEAASVHALTGRKHPEPEWEFGEMNAMGGVWPIKPDISPELWASTPVERRRRRIAPGPWVPVGEEEQ